MVEEWLEGRESGQPRSIASKELANNGDRRERCSWNVGGPPRSLFAFEKRQRAAALRGLLITADHLGSAHAILPAMVDLKSWVPRYSLRPFQEKAAGTKGNVILRAPTGSGKTEASLAWAATNGGTNARLFYSLPFTAAINAMHLRLQAEFPLQRESIGVLHDRAAHHL